MLETILLSLALGGPPTPHFGPLPVKLPTPHFGPLPVVKVDPFAEEPQIHTGKPTVTPKVVNHTSHSPHLANCAMCLGQHLRNAHGESNAKLDNLGYQNWWTYHASLHKGAAYVAPVRSCPTCQGGSCQVGPLRRLFGGWR